MGQIASSLNNMPQGGLPSDTQNPGGEGKECKAITFRGSKELENMHSQKTPTDIVDEEDVE